MQAHEESAPWGDFAPYLIEEFGTEFEESDDDGAREGDDWDREGWYAATDCQGVWA